MKDSAQQRALRERFCGLYLLLGNGEEAAIRAGVPPAEALLYADTQLRSSACRKMLQRLSAASAVPVHTLVMNGLIRLAFGRANDAARLVFADEMPSEAELAGLDLFHVSEIKRVKGGGVEIKLSDRQKAMERLLECADQVDAAASASALLAAFAAPKEATDDGDESDPCTDAGTDTDAAAFFTQAMQGDALVAG